MASPASSKKQIIQSIKDKKSILVTVSNNPSVDELAAALGLTIFLNKLDKHATAIASGDIPSALDFLDPEKTFEATADSLRDFIIALDKEKADHLRYKLDGDVVKIFITPYRTTITQDDLEFSQGDYNVEMVLALNVASTDDLDKALSAHGKILHDATVATISMGDIKSSLGTIEWHEEKVSGVSEMVTEIVQELKTAKADIDEQIASALLTGIVASTERFSNELTSSKVMTMSAELMASGANQQLIAAKLQEGEQTEETDSTPKSSPEPDTEEPTALKEDDPTRLSIDRSEEAPTKQEEPTPAEPKDEAGAMNISHEREGDIDDIAKQVMEQSQEEAARAAEAQLSQLVEEPAPEVSQDQGQAGNLSSQAPASITQELEQATEQMQAQASPEVSLPTVDTTISPSTAADPIGKPMVGGTLNATTAAAAEQKRNEILSDQNRTILTHGTPLAANPPAMTNDAPMNAAMAAQADEPPMVDIFAEPPASLQGSGVQEVTTLEDVASTQPEGGSQDQDAQQSAMADVQAALATPSMPPVQPADASAPGGQPSLADIEAGFLPPLPPMPDFSSLPPLPPAPGDVSGAGLPTTPPPTQADPQQPEQPFNPSQFQIPPQ